MYNLNDELKIKIQKKNYINAGLLDLTLFMID